jgi:hypothetical protein
MKNECLKERKVDDPYEVWMSRDRTWEWRVLKKCQVDDNKPYARWMCAVKSPFTYGSWEYGDVYVKDIKDNAFKVTSKLWKIEWDDGSEDLIPCEEKPDEDDIESGIDADHPKWGHRIKKISLA